MKGRRKKEFVVYILVLIVGITLIWISSSQEDFTQDLLLSLGSDLTAVTIVFLIFKLFSERTKVPEELRDKFSDRASPSPRTIQRQYEDASSVANDNGDKPGNKHE